LILIVFITGPPNNFKTPEILPTILRRIPKSQTLPLPPLSNTRHPPPQLKRRQAQAEEKQEEEAAELVKVLHWHIAVEHTMCVERAATGVDIFVRLFFVGGGGTFHMFIDHDAKHRTNKWLRYLQISRLRLKWGSYASPQQ
jgi:hypothetical protein